MLVSALARAGGAVYGNLALGIGKQTVNDPKNGS